MGKKNKAKEVVEENTEIWCYYCDRKFSDEKVLIQHQKAKHFKCHVCQKKLSTAGGLLTHVTQVHKEAISRVPNAITGREFMDVEIFGMEGIPDQFLPDSKRLKTEISTTVVAAPIVPIPPPPPFHFGTPFLQGGFPPFPGVAPRPPPPLSMPVPPPSIQIQHPPPPVASFSPPLVVPPPLPPPPPPRPPAPPSVAAPTDFKLVYDDNTMSMEEKRAMLPRYRYNQ